jgi:hypothetical protein
MFHADLVRPNLSWLGLSPQYRVAHEISGREGDGAAIGLKAGRMGWMMGDCWLGQQTSSAREATMSRELSVPEQLRANAEFLVATFRDELGRALAFDQSGIEWIDGYIERVRADFPAGRRAGLVSHLGAFVGECIIHSFGGVWVEQESWWGVQVTERFWACPFAKIDKQFENGAEDSVASFFRCIPVLARHWEQNTA